MPQETYTDTMDQLLLRLRAGCPVIYLVSFEEGRVLDNIVRLLRVIRRESPNKELWTYYDGFGLRHYAPLPPHAGGPISPGEEFPWLDIPGLGAQLPEQGGFGGDAVGALKTMCDAAPNNNVQLSDSIAVFFDLHPWLQEDGAAVRPLRNAADHLRRYYEGHRISQGRPYKTVIIVAPTESRLSHELERDLVKMRFPLPEGPELHRELLRIIEGPEPPSFPSGLTAEVRQSLCDKIAGAGRGLTLEDYRRGLQLFNVSGLPLNDALIEQMHLLKARAIKGHPALEYSRHDDFALGGLTRIEEWIDRRKDPAVRDSVRRAYHLPAPKGVMLCGVSGGGKSQLAKLIAKVFSLALLRLDVGALFGKYVGEAEENTRNALRLAETLAPVVLWLDEVDKAFSGMDGASDGGVASRVFGQFLTWMSEKRDNVFVVATANDFRRLFRDYPEFMRRGRFDEIFWVDLPDQTARESIFRIYLKKHTKPDENGRIYLNLDAAAFDALCRDLSAQLVSQNMTGAEIEAAVSEALFVAYDADRASGSFDKFTPALIRQVVTAAMNRALYVPGGDAHVGLVGGPAMGGAPPVVGLRTTASNNHWISVP